MKTYRLPTFTASMKQGLIVPSTVDGGGSSLYRALKLQRPTVIKWQDRLANSVSLIGSVLFSPTQCNTNNDRFGVHTILRAKSTRDFGIKLCMWDEMAEIASKHLRRNDVVYVSGRLKSYTQASEDGETKTKFQVNVKELNYVAPILRPYHPAEPEIKKSGTGSLESQKYRLHLWQIFFSNPRDWWDNRKRKAHSRQPDFRHKDTNEALWLSPNDPPWVKRQLELLDMAREQGFSTHARMKHVIPWDYDEEYIGRLLRSPRCNAELETKHHCLFQQHLTIFGLGESRVETAARSLAPIEREIGVSAVAGFVAEKVAGELLQNLLQISTSFLFCRGSAEDLKDTVHALFPVIEEIRGSGVDVPEPRRSHMDQISRCLQEGLEITRKILESPRYSVYRKIQRARKMDKLEKDISRFTRVIIQANILAEMSHIRSEGAESFHRLEGSNHRIECSLLEIKAGRGIKMAGSSTEIPDDAEEAWGSASRRERETVSDGYPVEETWAIGGHGRETEKGCDGYAAEEAWGSASRREGGKFAEGYPAEEAWATDGHGREGEKGGDEYDKEEAWSVGGCGRKGVKDVEEWAGPEEDIAVVGISGLKCGLKKDSSV